MLYHDSFIVRSGQCPKLNLSFSAQEDFIDSCQISCETDKGLTSDGVLHVNWGRRSIGIVIKNHSLKIVENRAIKGVTFAHKAKLIIDPIDYFVTRNEPLADGVWLLCIALVPGVTFRVDETGSATQMQASIDHTSQANSSKNLLKESLQMIAFRDKIATCRYLRICVPDFDLSSVAGIPALGPLFGSSSEEQSWTASIQDIEEFVKGVESATKINYDTRVSEVKRGWLVNAEIFLRDDLMKVEVVPKEADFDAIAGHELVEFRSDAVARDLMGISANSIFATIPPPLHRYAAA